MGCFSYICQECGESIQSSSFTGDHCKLFLLKDGKVLEEMTGLYNSYGAVFKDKSDESLTWLMDWGEICDLDFNGNDADGIAAFHTKCWTGDDPTHKSDWDPDQGWGNPDEPRGYYSEYE